MTEAERICVSFRDQSANWSWESVIPLRKGRGERIATASVRTGFAMTWFLQGVRCKSGRADRGVRPYGEDARLSGGVRAPRPTEGLQEVPACGRTEASGPTDDKEICASPVRADVGIGPYENATRGAMGGRPQGSPLRRAARNVWAGYWPLRKFFDREGMVCFGFWWRRMTRAPGC